MGHLIYGVAPAIRINDRALEHLRLVITTKLRRNESFSFSWDDEPGAVQDDALPGGSCHHGAVWLSRSSSLYFQFDGPMDEPINREWLNLLAQSADSAAGLHLVPEPEPRVH